MQATQNTAVLETDLTDAYQTSPVITVAGQQIVSLQLLEQSPIPFDEVVLSDLIADLATRIDVEVLNGAGTSGHLTGILNTANIGTITYTQASPTVPLTLPKILSAVNQVHVLRFQPATHLWMTPTRWAWLLAAVDSNNRPYVVPADQGPWNAVGTGTLVDAQNGPVGSIAGMRVFVDASIPANLGGGTNQDVVIAVRAPDIYLWEGATATRALPQTLGNQLSVLFQVYQYVALAVRYPQSVQVVSGTGLIQPTF